MKEYHHDPKAKHTPIRQINNRYKHREDNQQFCFSKKNILLTKFSPVVPIPTVPHPIDTATLQHWGYFSQNKLWQMTLTPPADFFYIYYARFVPPVHEFPPPATKECGASSTISILSVKTHEGQRGGSLNKSLKPSGMPMPCNSCIDMHLGYANPTEPLRHRKVGIIKKASLLPKNKKVWTEDSTQPFWHC